LPERFWINILTDAIAAKAILYADCLTDMGLKERRNIYRLYNQAIDSLLKDLSNMSDKQ
jgi:hypothetical protein